MKQGGDDLGDDFVLDDLVALSEEEDDHEEEFHTDEAQEPMSAEVAGDDAEGALKVQSTPEKKRKRRGKAKEQKAKVCSCTAICIFRCPLNGL
jgi:protein CMS1